MTTGASAQLELGGDGDRRQRVQHVVVAGQVERDLQVGHAHAVAALHREAHRAGVRLDVDGAHHRVGAEAVADHRPRDHRHDRAHAGIVDAQDRGAVERHPVDELDERLLQPREVVAVGVHVVGVDVRDDGHHRQQVQERRVRLVGLDDDVVADAEARVGAGGVEPAADHEGRVEAGLGEHAGDEAGRRRLAVRAGDRDALLQAHQLGQHHGARHDRHAARARGDHLGVVGAHRGRRDDRLGAGDVIGVVADRDADAERGERPRRRALALVGARDRVAEVVQDLGDAAHAGTADADEVDVLDGVLHAARVLHAATIASISSATRAAACGRASARAFVAIASSASRVRPLSRSASRPGDSSPCGRWIAALARRHPGGVVALVRGRADDERHEHGGDAGGAQLAHRDRAGAADDHVALAEARRHVVDEGQHLGVGAGCGVGGANGVAVPLRRSGA